MNTRAICLYLCIAALFTLSASCNKLAGGGSGGVKHPPSWPIKTLTIPTGAKQVPLYTPASDASNNDRLFIDGAIQSPDTDREFRDWKVAFSYSGSKDDVRNHINECLKPLGYLFMLSNGQPTGWISPDHTRWVYAPQFNIREFNGYVLEVVIAEHPRPDIAETTPIP